MEEREREKGKKEKMEIWKEIAREKKQEKRQR